MKKCWNNNLFEKIKEKEKLIFWQYVDVDYEMIRGEKFYAMLNLKTREIWRFEVDEEAMEKIYDEKGTMEEIKYDPRDILFKKKVNFSFKIDVYDFDSFCCMGRETRFYIYLDYFERIILFIYYSWNVERLIDIISKLKKLGG